MNKENTESKKKHVVIIMADQLRYDMAGGSFMPNLELAAQQGVRFAQCRCASPLCVPARGSFFTGRYPNETGSIINPWDANERVHGLVRKEISHLFGAMEKDWDIRHVGKRHFMTEEKLSDKVRFMYSEFDHNAFLRESGKRPPGAGEGFRQRVPEMLFGRITRGVRYSTPHTGCYTEGEEYYYDSFFTKGCLEAIEKRDRNKPLFLSAMMLAPHPPLEIPEPWYSFADEVSLPENVGRWYEGQSPLQLYNLTGAIGSRYTREEWREPWRVYTGLVAMLDDCIGKIIQKLKDEGIYDDTLLVFTSDHGEMLGSHSLFQKMCMYEESVVTPLVIRFPADYIPSCPVVEDNVSAVDVFPTLLDYLGLPAPEKLSGVSLLPLAEGRSMEDRELFIQFDGNGARGNFQRCVVRGDYKLILDIFKDEIFIELYNVRTDRMETENLAAKEEYAGLVRELIGKIDGMMKETGDLLCLPEGVYESFLRNAGYIWEA